MTRDQVPRIEEVFKKLSSKDMVFSPRFCDGNNDTCHIIALDIRFSNSKYSRNIAIFEEVQTICENCPGGAMALESDYSKFVKGIINISVGCLNHGYRFEHLIGMVKRIQVAIKTGPAA